MTNESKRDWENLFEPIDFCDKAESDRRDCLHGKGNDWCCGTTYSQIANEIIRKELEKAPVVYGTGPGPNSMGWSKAGNHMLPEDIQRKWPDTHTARLICIEEIKRDPIKLPNQVKE